MYMEAQKKKPVLKGAYGSTIIPIQFFSLNQMKYVSVPKNWFNYTYCYCQGDPVEIAHIIKDSVNHDLKRCLEEAQQYLHISGQKLALIIDGKCLMYALDPNLRVNLLNLSLNCSSVVCCRVSPLQKAQVKFGSVLLIYVKTFFAVDFCCWQ